MSGARFPDLPPESLTEAQSAAVQHLMGSARAGTGGPFIPLLRSPRLMTRLSDVGEYVRFESDLPRSIFEMTVLLVARAYDQPFEWSHHVPLAVSAGLSEAAVGDIADRRRPAGLDPAHLAAYEVARELLETRQLADVAFDVAISELGEASLIDLVGALGYYMSIAMVLNAARISGPATGDDELPTIDSGWSSS